MAYGKQDVLKLIQDIPEENFDAHKFLEDLAFRITIEERIREAEQGIDLISDEEARKLFKWL